MIPDHLVDEVRTRADIVEIVGEHVPLKKAGKEYRALCPFHQEKTPSFYVIPSKGFYNCFGCGESGDVFTFLMKRLGLEFQDAVRTLAARYGVDIPETRGAPSEDPYRALREALAFAADYYQRILHEDERGEKARAYLQQRGLDLDSARRFQLGAAPDDWRALREAAAKHGIGDEILLEAGLIKVSEREDSQHEPYDRFRDRLMFPICDVGGRVVAFGGRVLGKAREGIPKYLNSPETPIYHKGSLLYGIAWARGSIRREGKALLVEGNMDYVSLAARGIENVVAGLGTALTEEQAALMARYARSAVLIYDSDAAGLRATFKTGDALLRAGVHPLVATLPTGEDPDSLVRKGGPQALRPFIEAAVDVLDRKLAILDERGYFGDIDGIRRGLDRLLPTLRAATDPALRDIYVARVAAQTGVKRETLEHELTPGRPYGARDIAPHEVPVRRPRPDRIAEREKQAQDERLLLTVILVDPPRIPDTMHVVAPEEFGDPLFREVFQALVERGEVTGVEAVLSPAAAARLAELRRLAAEITNADQTFLDTIASMRRRHCERRLAAIEFERSLSSVDTEIGRLVAEQLAVKDELKAIDSRSKAAWRGWAFHRRKHGPKTMDG
jgi:DNA primase